MVAAVPAQISKLRPRPTRHSVPSLLRLLTTHSPLPTLFLSPLCFLSLTDPFSRLPDHPILCFHVLTNHLAGNPFIFTSIQNPRGVTPPCDLCAPISVPSGLRFFPPLATSPLFSSACRLFFSLGPLLQARSLCFQPFTASFRKTPGVGCLNLARHSSLATRHFTPQPAWWRRVRGYRCE